MYSILEIAGIETPRHAILLRDEDGNPINTEFVELDDSVQIGDKVFQKPFVEKPVDAEDHNVYIYFPSAAGGGSQRLFRKVGDRSSVYSPVSSVRKEGSYIYEDFVVTDGTDVKVKQELTIIWDLMLRTVERTPFMWEKSRGDKCCLGPESCLPRARPVLWEP